MTNKSIPASNFPKPAQIDLLKIAHVLWKGRRTLFKVVPLFALLGLLIAIFSPCEYTASITMIPQLPADQSKLSGLAGLASTFGVNLNMGAAADIDPSAYPQIITSIPFQTEMMKTPLNFRGIDHAVTFYDYYTEFNKPSPLFKYTIGLPGLIRESAGKNSGEISPVGDNELIRLSPEQKKAKKILEKLLTIDYNDKEGYILLTCRMPEALPAAQLAKKAQELLQQYVTEFKVQKAKANLEFISQRHDEVKKEYDQARHELAKFRDRNRNMATATAQTELERLNNDYNLLYEVYSELSKQLEQARIQVKENTPVFTIIKPVYIPAEKSRPERPLILTVWIIMGCITGTGILFGRRRMDAIREQWKTISNVSHHDPGLKDPE